MKYEKDLEYLRRELKNAQNIYDEAEENERESDAEMWMNRITHLEFQIDVFKNAAKADEYKAKAKAFDEISDYWRTKDMLKLGHFVDKAIRKYAGECESGESE